MTDILGLRGQPSLVVGGGSGIGRATALLLAEAGANVAIADVDASRAEAACREAQAFGVTAVAIQGDVTVPEQAVRVVEDAYSALGGLYALVNIVGLASWGYLLDLDLATWEQDLRQNLTHHLHVGRAAARHMIADRVPGSIALVASVSGLYGAPNHGAYGAAKAATMALARTMADEWGPHGIRVNCVAPDIIATPRVVAGFTERGVTDMQSPIAGDGVPLARWGQPEEIAGPLVFLVSRLAGFMTGQTLVVDGGTQAHFPHGGTKPFGSTTGPSGGRSTG